MWHLNMLNQKNASIVSMLYHNSDTHLRKNATYPFTCFIGKHIRRKTVNEI